MVQLLQQFEVHFFQVNVQLYCTLNIYD